MLKHLARAIDHVCFGDAFRRAHGTRLQARAAADRVLRMTNRLGTTITLNAADRHHTLLATLCDRYGSDKGSLRATQHPWSWKPHRYTDFYESMFSHCRQSVRLVFECGLGTTNPGFANNMGPAGRPGASLRAWRDYFPNALICGGDIDASILFTDERIRTFQVDQTSPSSIQRLWEAVGASGFDLIVDDGMHTFTAGSCLFEHSFSRVREGGIYVVEDVSPTDWDAYLRFFDASGVPAELVRFAIPGGGDSDYSLFVIRRPPTVIRADTAAFAYTAAATPQPGTSSH